MVLPSSPIQYASRDNERPYVPDRELFYLTGLVEPGCVAVLVGGSAPRVEVFARPRDHKAELWTCLLYTSPSPRDLSTSRMPSSA